MSTHGFVGVRAEGCDYLQYNHSDSYPTWLGREMLKAVREVPVAEFREAARQWTLVDEQDRPTDSQLRQLYPLLAEPGEGYEPFVLRLGAVRHEGLTWYGVLRDYQGDLQAWVQDHIPVWPQAEELAFRDDISWGYLVNTDEEVLEIYAGRYHYSDKWLKVPVEQRPVSQGRYFADPAPGSDQTPLLLVARVPIAELRDLPEAAAERWCKTLERRQY